MAAARVKGAQGSSYAKRDKVVTSVKHFVGYGQPEGGRDYNTTDMSESMLRNLYLLLFKAAIDAGSDHGDVLFNAINGVPGCANSHTETDILKMEWGFDGFIESDFTAVAETRACPPVATIPRAVRPRHRGRRSPGRASRSMAGTDLEMVSTNIRDFGSQLLAQHRITMSRLDDAVRRILRVEFRAGLFAHPFVDQAEANDPASFLTPADRAAARPAASKSMVLLKNDNATLPFDPAKKTEVIGPLGTTSTTCSAPGGDRARTPTPSACFDGLKAQSPGTTFVQGCTLSNDEPPVYDPANHRPTDSGFAAAVAAAQSADQVALAVGETREMSGEATSRTTMTSPVASRS